MEENESAVGETDVAVENKDKNVYGIEKDYFITPENKKLKLARDIIYVFLAALIYVVGFHYFVTTSNFAPGGVGGVVAIFKYVFKVTVNPSEIDYSSLLFIGVNIPLLIPAWKILSKDFTIKTACTATLIGVMMFLLDNFIDPNYKFSITGEAVVSDTGTRLLAAITGGAVTGVSLAIALKVNSSTGGADIVGAMVQKKNPHKSVASMIFAVNCVIIAVSFFVYENNPVPVFLSLIFLFSTTYICDRMMQGAKSALKFEVITEHAEEISKEIIQQLGHGVTITPAEGMFEHRKKQLLICVISPRQVAKFTAIISKYQGTFAYVGSVNEIIGKFNKTEKKSK